MGTLLGRESKSDGPRKARSLGGVAELKNEGLKDGLQRMPRGDQGDPQLHGFK